MCDRRVVRGSNYASMVVPATAAPNKPKIKEMSKKVGAAGSVPVISTNTATVRLRARPKIVFLRRNRCQAGRIWIFKRSPSRRTSPTSRLSPNL